jgi:hypothetical protein
MRRLAPVVLFLLLTFVGCAAPATGWTSTTRPYSSGKGTLNLLIMGDWGCAKPAQKEVADAVANYIRKNHVKFDACLSPGDNFYVNLRSVDDPQWQTVFEKMYDPKVFNFPFYCVYGNHDYEGNKRQIELDYAKKHPDGRFKMASNWYRYEIPAKDPLVTILAVDSCKGEMPVSTWEAEKAWLENEVQKPKETPWLMWFAHHPSFSNGKNGDALGIQVDWQKLIVQSHADFYIAGHEHGLQHLEIQGWPTIIASGGGGQRLVAMRRDDRGPFSRSTYGFVHLTLTEDVAEARLIDSSGNLLHLFTRDRHGNVKVWSTSASDPRTYGWFRSLIGD